MGLDMYITRKPPTPGGEHRFSRFYALHAWMERRLGPLWNEREITVPRAVWEELLALCDRLLPYREHLEAPPAGGHPEPLVLAPGILRELESAMPPGDGSGYYDKSFFDDLADLQRLLATEVLAPGNDGGATYTYLAWW